MIETEARVVRGLALMCSVPDWQLEPNIWGAPNPRMSPNFRLQWIKECNIPVAEMEKEILRFRGSYQGPFAHDWNSLSQGGSLRTSDGTELPLHVGAILVNGIYRAPSVSELCVSTHMLHRKYYRLNWNVWHCSRDEMSSKNQRRKERR